MMEEPKPVTPKMKYATNTIVQAAINETGLIKSKIGLLYEFIFYYQQKRLEVHHPYPHLPLY